MNETFDTIVIGGGIVGAGIYRDLSLHNIKTLLIDKNDFTSHTSMSSSKMLHGGIRYLENFDFHLVYEALHEKNLWLKIAPHLCFEERFYLPVYNDSKRPLWMIKIGLFLYDLLSGFENTGHQVKNKNQTLEKISNLKQNGLQGSGIYSDAVVDDAKMTLEMIYDGNMNQQCQAHNYHEFISEKKLEGNLSEYHQITVRDVLTNSLKTYQAKNIIYALGPFTDLVLNKVPHYHWKNILLPSKGSHLWFKNDKLNLTHPIVMTTNDDRVIFVIPQSNKVLVGTTEVNIKVDNTETLISASERKYLLNELNNYFPHLNLDETDIIGSYSGIRPLVKESDSINLGKTSREHRIVQLRSNIFVIAGGKYTTFRVMGQEIVRNIVQKKGKSYNDSLSTLPLRQKSVIPSFSNKYPSIDQIKEIIEKELPKTNADFLERRVGMNREYLLKNNLISLDELDKKLNLEILSALKPVS
jgi:glycerol-3-phosphate dehydrogenase